jgi:hypothetical protein
MPVGRRPRDVLEITKESSAFAVSTLRLTYFESCFKAGESRPKKKYSHQLYFLNAQSFSGSNSSDY